MKPIRLFTVILSFALSAQLFSVGASAKLVVGVSGVPEKKEAFTQPLSVPTENVADNRLALSNFDDNEVLDMWTKMTSSMVL